MSSLVKKMVKAQGTPEMDKPEIRVGQGDKNAPITFFYRPNSPDVKNK